VCVSVRQDISGTTCAIFIKFFIFCACCLWPWSFSGKVTKSQGEGAILEVFFPIHNALYSIAFGTHTKTAEPIDMLFGVMSGLGPRNSVLRGGDDRRRGRGNFKGKHVPDKSNTARTGGMEVGLNVFAPPPAAGEVQAPPNLAW